MFEKEKEKGKTLWLNMYALSTEKGKTLLFCGKKKKAGWAGMVVVHTHTR